MVDPAFLLFVQHGWADDNRAMMDLARRLVTDTIPVFAPSLGERFFSGEMDWQCGKMTQCQILSNLPSTNFRFLSWASVQ